MVDLKNKGWTRRKNDLDTAAVEHDCHPATIGSSVECGRGRVHSIMNDSHATTHLDWIAMKLVYLAANCEGDLLPDPCFDRFLHGSRISDIANDGSLGILSKEFGEESRAIPWCACATAVSQVTKDYWPFLSFDGFSDSIFYRNHKGVKGMPLCPAGFFDLFGNVSCQVWFFVGRGDYTYPRFRDVRGEEPAQQ